MLITEYTTLDIENNEIDQICVDYENGTFLWTTKENWDQMIAEQKPLSK